MTKWKAKHMNIQISLHSLNCGKGITKLPASKTTAEVAAKLTNAGIAKRDFIRGNAPKGEEIVCQANVFPSNHRQPPFLILHAAPAHRVNDEATRHSLVAIPL